MTKEVLELDVEHHLQLSVDDFVGRSVAVLGITGSGKTNTAAVLIEELLAHGLPLTIVDIEGEYWGLRERFQILIAGRSEHAELPLEPGNAAALAEISLLRGISVILDLSEYTQDESQAILFAYVTHLWKIAGQERKPYQLVLEEAHEWILQGVRTPLKEILTRLALRGRKRGLGIILMSQRSAKVEKDILTQASLLFLHRVIHPVDMRVYADLVPLPAARVEEMVRSLRPGQVIVVYGHEPHSIQIRLRSTFHAGSTPTIGEGIQPELRQVDATLLQELQQLLRVTTPYSGEDALRKAERRIIELEQLLTTRDVEVARQAEQIALLSQLRVSMDAAVPSLTLPDHLSIEEAMVGRVTIHQEASREPLVVESTASISPHLQLRTAPVIESLKGVVNKLNPRQKQVFKLLVQHGTVMDTGDIAAWLGVSRRTAQGYVPPDALIRIGLVKQVKRGHGFAYQATLKEYLAHTLPGVDAEEITHQLFPLMKTP